MKLVLTTIILFVQDVVKLKKIYTENLQLTLVEETSEWVLLQAGPCQIGLHKAGKEYLASTDKDVKKDTNTKIVFEMEDDLAEMRERLIKAGITVREIKAFPNYGFWICDGEDPEGNVFQLKQKKN